MDYCGNGTRIFRKADSHYGGYNCTATVYSTPASDYCPFLQITGDMCNTTECDPAIHGVVNDIKSYKVYMDSPYKSVFRCDQSCTSFGGIIVGSYRECLYSESCPTTLPLVQIVAGTRYCTASCYGNKANYYNVVWTSSNRCYDECTNSGCTSNC